MFDTILIANRGEIACRIARTCRRLGIHTVAVYSDADREALHVAACDQAWRLGPAPARDSYLRGDRIIEMARASGAQAIHPGYGFLSENADFAAACETAGLVFIGPPATAIRAMGSKSAAKTLLATAGVPLVPGYHDTDQDPDRLAAEAERIGYPVLIKASAGGGGKGMRVVESANGFPDALAAARREASSAFGDDQVLLEKYLLRPRHIELQVFADRHGNALHLFERDCSIQRRHQKILEEAPAPGMTAERRSAMGAAAIAATQAIGYVGAGTVEFIAEPDGTFYFMEMNTRLQVEHPVTELISGQDLVEWQLRVAAGEPLPCRQEQLTIHGHAIEARIYAEDPARDFLPASGRLEHLRTPVESRYVRIDSGVRAGDSIGIHYDPMIAKLIVWDSDRANALRRLRGALADYEIVGLANNIDFLRRLTAHQAYAVGEFDTGFIGRHHGILFPPTEPAPDLVLAIAVLSELHRIDRAGRAAALRSADPWSPWHSTSGWRLNDDNHHTLWLRDAGRELMITAHYRPDRFLLDLPEGRIHAQICAGGDGVLEVELDGRRLHATVVRTGDSVTVLSLFGRHSIELHDPLSPTVTDAAAGGSLTAPMPGNITAVLVEPGAHVQAGTALVVLEAMKMEHTIRAPGAGVVIHVNCVVGDQVDDGTELLALGDGDA